MNIIKRLMKVGLSLTMIVSLMATSVHFVSAANTSMTYPNVQEYMKKEGRFVLGDRTRIFVVGNEKSLNNERLLKDVQLMSSQFEATKVLNKAPIIVFGKEQDIIDNDIVVKMANTDRIKGKAESYQIDIDDHVMVTANDEVGIYYGLMSMIQMLKLNHNTLDYGTIVDYPDVGVRSMHMDIARKPLSKEWIIRQIKDLSWQKYNSVQLHFAENEGFRIQSDTLDSIKGFQYKYNNVLSKQDLLDIIEVANDYHIEIIPSLDSPGHLQSVLDYLPREYSCADLFSGDDRSRQCFNIFTNPEAKQFLMRLMSEFIEFFGDAGCKHFNIGGDEFLAQFERFDNDQYKQIMDYFNEVSKIVKDHGMIPRAWNDGLLYGDYEGYKLDSDIEICYWAAPKGCASIDKFVKNGHKVINYSDVYMYYVLSPWWQQNAVPEGDKIYKEWFPGKFSTLTGGISQTYEEPYPDYVLGGSYAIWCDLPDYETEERMEEKLYYRTRATAYKMWNTHNNQPNYNEFKQTVDKLGRTPGFRDQLPASGQVIQGEDSASITLKYVDNFGQTIANDEVVYGLKDQTYHFDVKELLGYRFIESDYPLDGTYNGHQTITLKYQLYCDKSALKKELFNPLATNNYIKETVDAYKTAFDHAKEVYFDDKSSQLSVNESLKTLQEAKKKAVLLDYYPLYVEVSYPLKEANFVGGYQAYKNAIDEGKALLASEKVTQEQVKKAYKKIADAKNQLVKPTGHKPQVEATDGYYNSYKYDQMLDHNMNTKCWFDQNQQIGKTITFTFPHVVNMTSIRVIQPSNVGDDVLKGADIEISLDGQTWNKVGDIKDGQLDSIATFNQTMTKYVRIKLTKNKPNWYQISEVEFTYEQVKEDHALKDLIEESEKLNIDGKDRNSVQTMVNALINAQKAYVNNKVDVKDELTALRHSIDALKDAVVAHKELLLAKINEARLVENQDYNHDDWLKFEKALLDSIVVYNDDTSTQEVVDQSLEVLTQAMNQLHKVVDTKALEEAIEKVKKLDAQLYSEESWNILSGYVDDGYELLMNKDITQEQVDDITTKILQAIEDLVLVKEPTVPTPPGESEGNNHVGPPIIIENTTNKPSQGGQSSTHDKVETSDYTSFMAVTTLVMATLGLVLLRKKKENV